MGSIAETLGIDPAQIATNVIGFAIFLWLMARYAWKPILGKLDERREEIAGNYRKIEEEKSDLDKLRLTYEGHLDKIEEEATRRVQEAIKHGQDAAHQIEDEAREKARDILEKARADTERILEEAKLELKAYVVNVGVEAGRKAAMEQLDEPTHRRLVERFVEELTHVR